MANNLNDESLSGKEWILRVLPVDYEYDPPTTPDEFYVAFNHVAEAMTHYGLPISYAMPALLFLYHHAFEQTSNDEPTAAQSNTPSDGQQYTVAADGALIPATATINQSNNNYDSASSNVLEDWSWWSLPRAVSTALAQHNSHAPATSGVAHEAAAAATEEPSVDAVLPGVVMQSGLVVAQDHNYGSSSSNIVIESHRVGPIVTHNDYNSATSDVDDFAATASQEPSIDAVFHVAVTESGLVLAHAHNHILLASNSNILMDSRHVFTIVAELLDSHNIAQHNNHNSAYSDVDEDTEDTQGPAVHTVPAGVPMMSGTGTMASGAVLTPDNISEPASSNVLFESWVANALSVDHISSPFS
jgi:hypothetical protein